MRLICLVLVSILREVGSLHAYIYVAGSDLNRVVRRKGEESRRLLLEKVTGYGE